jgi:hypothetical protein
VKHSVVHRCQFHQHFTSNFLLPKCFAAFMCLQFVNVIFLSKGNWRKSCSLNFGEIDYKWCECKCSRSGSKFTKLLGQICKIFRHFKIQYLTSPFNDICLKTTLSNYNLKILRPKVTKIIQIYLRNFVNLDPEEEHKLQNSNISRFCLHDIFKLKL